MTFCLAEQLFVATGASGAPLGVIPLKKLRRVNGGAYIFRVGSRVVLLSTKLTFPASNVRKIGVILPSIACLQRGDRGVGNVVIARKRRSRVNKVTFRLGRFSVPIVCNPHLTVTLLRGGLRRTNITSHARVHGIHPHRAIHINGSFLMRCVHGARSVTSDYSIVVRAPIKIIVRANSFGFSFAPISNRAFSVRELTRTNRQNILYLVDSSAGSRLPKRAPSRQSIFPGLSQRFTGTSKQLVMAAFSSSIRQIGVVLRLTRGRGHGIFIIKQSVLGIVTRTHSLNCVGYPRDLFLPLHGLNGATSRGILVLAAKSRNRPVTTLAHVTSSSRQRVEIGRKSAIVFSTGPVPNGAVTIIGAVSGLVVQKTGMICNGSGNVRISNRNSRRSRGLVLTLAGPGCFLPIRNRRQVLIGRSRATRDVKIPTSRVIVVRGNSVMRISPSNVHVTNRIPSNVRLISSSHIKLIKQSVLGSQRRLTRSKIMAVTTTLNDGNGLITKPAIRLHKITRTIGPRQLRRTIHRIVRRILRARNSRLVIGDHGTRPAVS